MKEGLQKTDPDLRYTGFRIPPDFVIGYGLDVDESTGTFRSSPSTPAPSRDS